ncbi:MAG: hypothetical protein LBU15_00805 [Rickettsiales bacterium]|nr:hypothetical protein [Rickettsiales bacterium]
MISLLVGVSEEFVFTRRHSTSRKDDRRVVIHTSTEDDPAQDLNHGSIIFSNGTTIGYFPGGLRTDVDENMKPYRESIGWGDFVGDADIMDEAINNIRDEFQPEGSGKYGYDAFAHICYDFRWRAWKAYRGVEMVGDLRKMLKEDFRFLRKHRDWPERLAAMEDVAEDRRKKELDKLYDKLSED